MTQQSEFEKSNEVLEDSKEKFQGVVVLGVSKDGSIAVNTNLSNIFEILGVLNVATFKLNVFQASKET